jgi:hypothetical protein
MAQPLTVQFPIDIPSVANVREHWATKAARAKKHRGETYLQLRCTAKGFETPCVVTLTRIAPRALDGDNLQSALKACRDGVADWLKVDDGDPRVTWLYAQSKGKPKQCALRVEVQSA